MQTYIRVRMKEPRHKKAAREAVRRWSRTPKGQACRRAYRQKPRIKAKDRAYQRTQKYRTWLNAYRRTPKQQAYYRAYKRTPKARAYRRDRYHAAKLGLTVKVWRAKVAAGLLPDPRRIAQTESCKAA
jgi:hypothetical protein